jgi:iron complex transport system substrate-binding protein
VTLDQQIRHWRGVADAVGRSEAGDTVVADLEGRIAALADRFAGAMADKPVSILRVGTDAFYSVRFGSLESSLLKAVGIPRPANQQVPEDFAFDLSMERLEDVDAWAILVYVDEGADGDRLSIEANPLWAGLGAVEAGRVFTVDAGVWNGLDPIAADLVLDDIDRHLGAALATEL